MGKGIQSTLKTIFINFFFIIQRMDDRKHERNKRHCCFLETFMMEDPLI